MPNSGVPKKPKTPMAESQESSLINEGGDDPNGTAAGLRRSKRNKYHLNLLDVLKSGTSSHRDYSPPTKKWATRRPEPTILDPLPQQQPRISPRKNAGLKKELVQKTTTENATNTTEKGKKTNAIENEVVPQLQPQEKAPPIDVNLSRSLENPDSLENAGEHKRETAQEEKPEEVAVEVNETAPPSLVEENNEKQVLVQSQSKSISGGLLPTIDIQLPDQILEEDDFPATTSASATTAESSSNNIPSPNDPKKVATSSNPSFMLSSSEVVKRKRKVPLRHLDYTNDDSSDLDEERMFKAIKVEYTVTDGTKAADDHSCPRCPAIFESRVGLTNHLKLHGSKKHFPCELCDFSCTNKKTMRQHRRVHGLAKRPKRESLKVAMAMKSVEKAKKQSAAGHESIGKEIKKEISASNKDLKVQAVRKEIKCEQKGEVVDDGGEKFIVIKSLDEIGAITEKGSEKAVDLDAEGMPILEQQEDIPVSMEPVEEGKPSNEDDQLEEEEEATNDSNSTGTRKNDRNLPLGFYKKGSRIYDRNTVKCPYANCPFRTQSKVRLNPHVEGHNRPVGFVCSICLFKSDSTGHLRRHCQLHRDTYKWPPDYEGIKPSASAANGTATIAADLEQATNDRNIVDSNSPGQDQESEKQQQQPQQEKQQQIHIGDITAAVEAARKMGYEWGGGEGEDQQQRCWEGECAFVARIKGEMFAHRWRHHREKFFPNLRADSSMSFYKSNCIQCGLLFRSGPVGLTLHRGRHHTGISKQRRTLCRELLEERLAWRPVKENAQSTTAEKTINLNQMNSSSLDEDDKAEKEKVMITQKSTDSNSKETDSTSTSSSSSKIYNCRSCPYTTDQIFRLQKHENKHLVKAEYQCSNCSFSCRSLDILAQHIRLHEINTNSNPPSPALKPEAPEIASSSVDESHRTSSPPEQSSESAPVTQKLLSFRRNETHYCPYCPYKSKHNCDMKAHLKMHEERRKFICNYCSYSTMRQNALLAHEKIHQIKNAEKGKCRRMKVIFNRVKGVGILTRGPILGERMQLAGTGIAFYRCAVKQCAAEFPFCAGLTQHARHHQWAAGMKAFTCPTCDFKTDLEKRMQSHQTIHRIDEEKNIRSVGGIFHCKECPYATANYAKFWNHRQKHKRKARFACTHCSFSSGSVQCYAEHLELHNKANGNEDAGANNLDQKEEKEDVKAQNGDVSKKEDNSTVEKLNNQPLFQRDKYELFSSALPIAQLKLLGILGKSKKEQQESGSTSSSSISSFSKAKHLKYCKECPYKTSDSVLLKLHQDMHRRTGTRPFSCTLCTFGCFSAESLHTHLSLHASTTGTENVGDEIDPAAMLSKVTTSTASSAFQCSQCNFKCIELEGFLAHRKEHVQLLQQRLMTIIKRSGNENVASNGGVNGLKDKVKSMRGKQTDKQHYCSKCSFRCDSVQAFSLHWEHHNNNNNEKLRKPYFRCTICDYSSDTKNVVIFHEKNHHHLDVPLTSLYQQSTQVQ